jgi:hypothetical protein
VQEKRFVSFKDFPWFRDASRRRYVRDVNPLAPPVTSCSRRAQQKIRRRGEAVVPIAVKHVAFRLKAAWLAGRYREPQWRRFRARS